LAALCRIPRGVYATPFPIPPPFTPLIRRQSVAVSPKPLLFLGQLQRTSKNFQFATAANTQTKYKTQNQKKKTKKKCKGKGKKTLKTPNTFQSNEFVVQSEINRSLPAEEERCEAEKNLKLKTKAKVFNVRLWDRLQVQAGWPAIGKEKEREGEQHPKSGNASFLAPKEHWEKIRNHLR